MFTLKTRPSTQFTSPGRRTASEAVPVSNFRSCSTVGSTSSVVLVEDDEVELLLVVLVVEVVVLVLSGSGSPAVWVI